MPYRLAREQLTEPSTRALLDGLVLGILPSSGELCQ